MDKDKASKSTRTKGPLGRLGKLFREPSKRYSTGFITVSGVILGVLLWGGFNWSLEVTNTEAFCISCHEMQDYVYQEYKDTIHYTNRTGVRATCPDCHVPKEWGYKMVRKIRATNELWHKALGSINTPEKFEAKRLLMARHVWESMEKTDSRECRNCHDNDSMDYFEQGRRGVEAHIEGNDEGKTCIECHRGIAHSLPALYEEDPSAVVGTREGS
jgi:nitrate/TMAO reductase-like tetraheme cytochrome c subunit